MSELDRLSIKRLENGFTVRHHLVSVFPSTEGPPKEIGESKEFYVKTKNELIMHITGLLENHIAP
jgi:hypothetical protein